MIIQTLDLLGVAVFAISGALVAGRKRLDLFGVVVIAAVTAIGGGTLRDLLLNRHPVFWIADPIYLYIILGAAALTLLYTRRFRPPERMLLVADAIGLSVFTISGAQIAEASGLSGIAAVLMGALTGAAGGVVRDVLTAEIPMILRKGQIYATASIAGAAIYLELHRLGVDREAAAMLGMSVVVVLRLSAIVWGIRLPVYTLREPDPEDAELPD